MGASIKQIRCYMYLFIFIYIYWEPQEGVFAGWHPSISIHNIVNLQQILCLLSGSEEKKRTKKIQHTTLHEQQRAENGKTLEIISTILRNISKQINVNRVRHLYTYCKLKLLKSTIQLQLSAI